MLRPSVNKSIERLSIEIFQRLIYEYPLAFWGTLWTSVVLLAGIALLNLLSAGSQEHLSPQKISVPATGKFQQPPPGFTKVQKSSEKAGNVPLDLFGAIAFSCASGSLLIVRQLKQAKRRKLTQRAKPATNPQKKVLKKQRPPQNKRRPSTPAKKRKVAASSVQTVPVVTILPPEVVMTQEVRVENKNLNLAEMLDIRKQRSLDSLLRNF